MSAPMSRRANNFLIRPQAASYNWYKQGTYTITSFLPNYYPNYDDKMPTGFCYNIELCILVCL